MKGEKRERYKTMCWRKDCKKENIEEPKVTKETGPQVGKNRSKERKGQNTRPYVKKKTEEYGDKKKYKTTC